MRQTYGSGSTSGVDTHVSTPEINHTVFPNCEPPSHPFPILSTVSARDTTYVKTTRGTWPYDGHQPRNTVVMP